MRTGRVSSLLAAAAALLALLGCAEADESVYTPIQREGCGEPPPAVREEFARRDLGVQECPAPDGWRLLFVSSDANSWLELRRDGSAWSGESAVVYERAIGLFPNVGGSPVVEWRSRNSDGARALIFRVVAQAPDGPERRVSRLLVVRLAPDGPCLIGRAATNEEARALADGPAGCPGS